jgi:predicted N-acyltransferase
MPKPGICWSLPWRIWPRDQVRLGVHVLFHDQADALALHTTGWLPREGTQFHWQAEASGRPRCFEDLLATLQRDKRKKVLQERRRVAESGIRFTVHHGSGITPSLWHHFFQCYRATYARFVAGAFPAGTTLTHLPSSRSL